MKADVDPILKLLTSVANVIAAMPIPVWALYGAGTDEGVGWKPPRLKPEFFEKQEEAKDIALPLNDESDKLAAATAIGDVDAIKGQFDKGVKPARVVTTTFVFAINKVCSLEAGGSVSGFLSFVTIMSSL